MRMYRVIRLPCVIAIMAIMIALVAPAIQSVGGEKRRFFNARLDDLRHARAVLHSVG